VVRLKEYVVFECMNCKGHVIYQNGRDGHRCNQCGGMLKPIDKGSKSDMTFKYNLDRLVPLGIEPKWVHRSRRLSELSKVIERYIKEGFTVPTEWIEEYNELNEKYGKHIRI
jgi:DNA-directed RNA polymerase subunit RPC12/RpoP